MFTRMPHTSALVLTSTDRHRFVRFLSISSKRERVRELDVRALRSWKERVVTEEEEEGEGEGEEEDEGEGEREREGVGENWFCATNSLTLFPHSSETRPRDKRVSNTSVMLSTECTE